MRVIEKVLIILTVIGIAFKLLHYPGGGQFIVIGLFLLSILYFGFSWLLMRDRETKAMRLGIAIPAGLCLSILCAGIMFKLQYWPDTGPMLLAGTILTVSMLIVILAVRPREEAKANGLQGFYRNVLMRAAIYAVIGATLFLTPSSTLLKMQYGDDPEYLEHRLRLLEDPDNEQYQREFEDMMMRRFNGEDTLRNK